MHSYRRIGFVLSFALVLAVLLSGCPAKSPEEKVAALRSQYTAELNSFVVRQPTVIAEPLEGEEMAAPEEAAGEAGEETGEEEMAPEPPPTHDVILDIVVRHSAPENLPGITIDLTHADSAQRVKGVYRIWADTTHISRGQHSQINHVLEGVDYEEGDGFHAEVRTPIPPEERGDYREFAAAARE